VATKTQVKVIGPEEVERRNIITKRELQAIVLALQPYGRVNASRRQLSLMDSARVKVEKVIAGMA
jgi:hypothetical protein